MTQDSKKLVRLECWSVHGGDGYTPPEHVVPRLHGRVYGHPKIDDGKIVSTSPIEEVHGHMIVTKSGTCYLLGTPAPGYLTWMAENNVKFDPENPIRVKNPHAN